MRCEAPGCTHERKPKLVITWLWFSFYVYNENISSSISCVIDKTGPICGVNRQTPDGADLWELFWNFRTKAKSFPLLTDAPSDAIKTIF